MQVKTPNEERNVIVVGGTSGIGAAVSRGLARAGMQVTATGLSPAEIDRFRMESPPGSEIRTRVLDVRSDPLVQELASGFERVHGLVICAGMSRGFDDQGMDAFAEVIDVNLLGTYRCCRAFLPALTRSGGSIVNVASIFAFVGGSTLAYGASKGGVAQLTRSMAVACARSGVRVNAIAPGWVRTPLTTGSQDDDAKSKSIEARTPLGRWGEPEDMVGPVEFLLSEGARYMTGCVMPVDGGYLAA
jgi:NAD(P)-dependent dehydrogenase (short-subunit alcohol dehydrogenase family)